MIYEDKNYSIIDEKYYNSLMKDINKNETFLYHFITVKYLDNNDIKTININQTKDLDHIKDKNILFKYYVQNIHYYNKFNNILYDNGEPYYIYNIGYFLIDGDVPMNDKDKELAKKMFDKYNEEYSNMKFPFNDEEFLSNNKSVVNF
jgi:hypothetical protein